MTSPRALWIPIEVDDFDTAHEFYTSRLGLSAVDGWSTESERGVVLRAGEGAYVELVSPGRHRAPPLAFQLGDRTEVDRVFAALGPAKVIRPPARYPRGHYGFEALDPAGTHVMLWHEG
ncbi:VOC family protein [Actinokineospora sp.]|uniref:VOC family protein n=1 Tax=Actinokineospora sp. TaxID=1872133 RepID=UPI0040384E0C